MSRSYKHTPVYKAKGNRNKEDGYISMCGHTPTDSIVWKKDRRYLDEPGNSIWRNDRHNVYLLDCGCGFAGGRLACLCLETKERFYA